jgi:hypothetical protein
MDISDNLASKSAVLLTLSSQLPALLVALPVALPVAYRRVSLWDLFSGLPLAQRDQRNNLVPVYPGNHSQNAVYRQAFQSRLFYTSEL